MSGQLPAEEAIPLALEAISDHAPERLLPLLSEGARVRTDRGLHEGVEAIAAWSRKSYQHLDRRYAVERIERRAGRYLVTARVEYVWRESGEVGDSSPAWLVFGFEHGLITSISLHDERSAAESALGD